MFVWANPSVRLDLPVAVSPANLDNLGAYMRDIYRAHYAHEAAAGALKPLVLPYAVLGTFVFPVLYLAVPHVRRPWLYRARWPLMAFIMAFNLYETCTSSSANFAIGYAVGLMQAWGILWCATLLIWMRPQFEAERVERRKRRKRRTRSLATVVNGESRSNGHAADATANGNGDGHVAHRSGSEKQNGHAVQANGYHHHHHTHPLPNGDKKGTFVDYVDTVDAPDEDIARSLREGYEYYWQAYPAHAPLATRLGWSLDLVLSFRGTGWNWGVPVIPHFANPKTPLSGELVDLGSIPLETRQGYRRYRTNAEMLRAHVPILILGYLAMDLLSVLVMKDPYFILGPEFAAAGLALPPVLASLPPVLLGVYRSLLSTAGILFAINLVMTLWQLIAHFLLPRALLTGAARGELWQYPSTCGAFVPNVLDRGLAGFWGGWWHQTFRTAFSAPSLWAARRGWLDLGLDGPGSGAGAVRGKAVAALVAFAQSGFLHTLGSVSCVPPTKPWLPGVFFLLCWVGIIVQASLSALLHLVLPLLLLPGGDGSGVTTKNKQQQEEEEVEASPKPNLKPTLPAWARRAGNLVFVCVWLEACQWLLCDDFGRSGLWLTEPVPLSPLRALGLGRPGDSPWRWDETYRPRWYYGGAERWWESGIAI